MVNLMLRFTSDTGRTSLQMRLQTLLPREQIELSPPPHRFTFFHQSRIVTPT